jgi:hypothetical protein
MAGDGRAYAIVNGGAVANADRIVRVDNKYGIETVVLFAADTKLTGVRNWLVKGPDAAQEVARVILQRTGLVNFLPARV